MKAAYYSKRKQMETQNTNLTNYKRIVMLANYSKNKQNQKLQNVPFQKKWILQNFVQNSLSNPVTDWINNTVPKAYQKRTVIQNNVPIGTFYKENETMKLHDKHREYAVKCYAAFMQPSDMLEAFMLKFQDEIPELQQLQLTQDSEEYNYQDEQDRKNIKEKLRNQLRRYDISHHEFPEKYRELFSRSRQEYILNYIGKEIQDANGIVQELEALYGYVKQCIYGLTPSDRTIKNLQIAQNLLDRIAEYKVKE